MFLEIKGMKGFRHIDIKSIYRRMDALQREGWIARNGNRTTQPGWSSELYEITLRGKAAVKLDQKSIEGFLKAATNEQLRKLIGLLS